MSSTLIVSALPGSDELRPLVSIPDHTLLRVIGRGSYGEVWEARNVMGTPRAVKIVRRRDFDSARPFEREFEGIQRYEPVSRTHAGLVQVLHVGMGADGDYFYYVMELADATEPEHTEPGDHEYAPMTLRSELHRMTALPVEECIEIGMTLASALGHLHRGGLVHRDVKPSNIIFVAGVPKMADVGLVARLSDSRSMVGTEGYFAPEGTGQPRSDVFSLGKVLYECVTGLDRMRFPDVPESWSSGPEKKPAFEFMEIVLRAAESDPARRYAGTEEMLADLALLKAGKSLRYLRRVETRLRRTLQILTFSALGIAVAGGAWFYERFRRGQVERAEQVATHAQQQTQRLLGESLVAEARAVRLSGQAGAREKAIAAVKRGRDAGASLTELRTQAASALALTDVGSFSPWEAGVWTGIRSVWSGDGAHLATATNEGKVSIRERVGDKEIGNFEVPSGIADIALSRGANWLAVVQQNKQLSLWKVSDGSMVWEQPISSPPHVPAFSDDGAWLVCSAPEGLVARANSGGEPITIAPGAPAMRHVLLAPNGKWVAALPEPVKNGDKEKDLGFRIYTGLPGTMPAAGSVLAIKASEIVSDIRLEGPSISADSRYLAAAVAEDRLRVWEVPSLAQVAWLRGHQRSVRGTAFHPGDSSIIASTSWDGTTRLWDIPTRHEVLVAPVGGDEVKLAPGRGEILLRTWGGETVRSAALSPVSALRVLMLPAHTRFGLFSGSGFSPDGGLFAAAGDAGVILWDLQDGSAHPVRTAPGPQEWRDAVFDPTNGALWCSGRTGLFRHEVTRDAAGKPVIGKPETVLTGWTGDLEWVGGGLAVSGRFTGDRKACVEIVRAGGNRQTILSPHHSPDNLTASSDGRWLAASGYPFAGGTLWDLSSDPPPAARIAAPGRCAFGFTSLLPAVMVGTDKEVRFDPLPGFSVPRVRALKRKNSEIVPGRSTQSPDGTLVAVSTGPNEVTLCEGRTLVPLLTLDSPLTPFDCMITFSPDSKKLALAGGVSRVVIWDIAWLTEELNRLGLGW